MNVRKMFAVGDVIEDINGIPVDSLIRKYASYAPASNFPTMLRNLSSAYGFLLRSCNAMMKITVYDGVKRSVRSVPMIPVATINPEIDFHNPKIPLGFRFLDDSKIL